MDLQQRVLWYFEQSTNTQRETAATISALVAQAGQLITECLLQGGKIICCGSGSSSGQAQHFAAALLNRFERERPGLPAIAIGHDGLLTSAIASDHSFKEIYAKQIKTLAQPNDVLLVMCAGRVPRAILEAVKAGHHNGMIILALTGDDSGEIADLLQSGDIELRVPAQRNANIQEMHLIIINSLCDLIDALIFGEES